MSVFSDLLFLFIQKFKNIGKLYIKKFTTEERTRINSNGNESCHTYSANEQIRYLQYPVSEIQLSNLSIVGVYIWKKCIFFYS